MSDKPQYQHIFDLLDYADEVEKMMKTKNSDPSSYFMTLVYIEDILDTYGRGLVIESAANQKSEEVKPQELLKIANQRLAKLRMTIRRYSQKEDFDQLLREKGESIFKDWHKLPDDHPSVQNLKNS